MEAPDTLYYQVSDGHYSHECFNWPSPHSSVLYASQLGLEDSRGGPGPGGAGCKCRINFLIETVASRTGGGGDTVDWVVVRLIRGWVPPELTQEHAWQARAQPPRIGRGSEGRWQPGYIMKKTYLADTLLANSFLTDKHNSNIDYVLNNITINWLNSLSSRHLLLRMCVSAHVVVVRYATGVGLVNCIPSTCDPSTIQTPSTHEE